MKTHAAYSKLPHAYDSIASKPYPCAQAQNGRSHDRELGVCETLKPACVAMAH